MKTATRATEKLHDVGQSLWLDNITRGLLTGGTLRRYIEEFSITGLTSNPTIFEHAFRDSHDYDDAIRPKLMEGWAGETLFSELAMACRLKAPFELIRCRFLIPPRIPSI